MHIEDLTPLDILALSVVGKELAKQRLYRVPGHATKKTTARGTMDPGFYRAVVSMTASVNLTIGADGTRNQSPKYKQLFCLMANNCSDGVVQKVLRLADEMGIHSPGYRGDIPLLNTATKPHHRTFYGVEDRDGNVEVPGFIHSLGSSRVSGRVTPDKDSLVIIGHDRHSADDIAEVIERLSAEGENSENV
jgi:hypothetical protein